jgi:3-oxoacyl-[acyl-carrier-protein] synthase-3
MVAQKLGIPADRVCHNIERYGNTTAATIPLGLSEAYEEGRLGEGKVVLTAAFGSGYTWAASVIRF